ncbi:penicillin-binding transpeptidase domain-containing protein [Clostridium sp. BJN0001]|uniref:penicillin-binding transpeptidase domain-containing protein n=1 Tax=Clostridium sp. BJN0001 TaxID=2930219 RepID=UPI001FCF98E2|nr:penicillin-binding transpeptidase domain-containing protein [Clostridium sp. BJN0001]
MIVNRPEKKKKISRYTILTVILFFILSVIGIRLAYLQILRYDEFKDKANVSATRFISETAPRGKIYDKNGTTLASNKQTYTITYTKNDDQTSFFSTMKELFQLLKENGESIQDNMQLKISDNNEIYFEYKTDDDKSRKAEELRFKKDRGYDYFLKNKDDDLKDVEQLNDEQEEKLDNQLVDKSAEETFYYLVKSYDLIGMVDDDYLSKEKKSVYDKMDGKELTQIILDGGYSLNDIREYMLVKDAIKMQSYSGYKAVTIAENLKKDTVMIIYQKLNDLPGINVSSTPIRYYPFHNLASSVLGYVSSIDSSQKDRYELRGYDASSDVIGKSGIESAFEDQLKGSKGGTTVKVNSKGRTTEELFKLESYPGNDVHLTIDADVQYAAEQALQDAMNTQQSGIYKNATRGALVAVDVNTGKVIALVSLPNYDPNIFTATDKASSDLVSSYFSPDLNSFGKNFIQRMGLNKSIDELFPEENGRRTDPYDLYPRNMYNYATMSLLPPGSTFKPLTAVAGIESGAIDTSTTILDTGEFNIHPETFGAGFNPSGIEYKQGGVTLGDVNLKKAIAESVNYYFYETAYRMYMKSGANISALDSIAKYAWQFGLGVDPKGNTKASTGIEIQENFGQVYNFTSWKMRSISSAKFEIVQYLEDGSYKGINSFIPFDFKISDDDNQKVADAKKSIKDKMVESLNKVGTDESLMSHDEFAKSVKDDIRTIMDNSDRYKQNVSKAESEGRSVNLDNQVSIIAESLAQFTINDKPGEISTPGQLVYASIGQSMNAFTPLQLVSYISTLANGGTRYKLHLVDKITDAEGNVLQQFDPEILNTVNMSKSTQQAIKEGMEAVNTEEGGTASSVFSIFPIKTAGKTGTADALDKQDEVGRQPYATYVSYAPAENPQIAVAAVVFDGGHGGTISTAVRAVFEAYFKDQIVKDYPNYASSSDTFKKYVLDNPNNEQEQKSQKENSQNIENTKKEN